MAQKDELQVGVISDTHGLMRPEAIAALARVDHIIHAGDIGGPHVLAALQAIAPVTAVRGNNDIERWATALPETSTVKLMNCSIYLIHNVRELPIDPAEAGVSAVVAGHSHQAAMDVRNGVLFFNPGSAGPRRFRLPISLGRLTIRDGTVRGKLITLEL